MYIPSVSPSLTRAQLVSNTSITRTQQYQVNMSAIQPQNNNAAFNVQEKGPAIAVQPIGQAPVFLSATPLAALGRAGAPADCPACGTRAMTHINFVAGNTTQWLYPECIGPRGCASQCWLCCSVWAAALFFFTLHCCCVPYFISALKDVEHRCGGCGVLLATAHKSGRVEVHQFQQG
jgi:lipopolysaccharide-induced tumor necrosis factor-alpha factor